MAASKAEILRDLRLLPGIKKISSKEDGFPAPGLPHLIPKGAVVELTGSAPTEWAIEFLVLNPKFNVFWCEKDQRIFPPHLEHRGFDSSTVLFGTYGEYLPDAVAEILRSKLYDAVISPSLFSERVIDRFGRLSHESKSILFLLRDESDSPSSSLHIDLQLEIHRGQEEGSFNHQVLKFKHGRL